MEKGFISKIVRDSERRPVGVVVALDKGKIGWSCLNKRDRWNKEKGNFIALARATNGYNATPPRIVAEEIVKMQDRARRYFDNPNPKHGPRAK